MSYLGFSLPAIAAGVAVAHAGLLHTTNVYGLVVIGLATWATGVTGLRRVRALGARA